MSKNLMTDEYNATLIDIKNIIFQSRDKAYKVISYATLDTYWKIGKRIFKEEQNGKERAAYGENLIKILSAELTKEYGKGFSERNLRNFRKFYILFPDKAIWQTCLPNLNWSHICSLLRVSDEAARLWYMKEAASEGWNSRTLDRNIGTQYYYPPAAIAAKRKDYCRNEGKNRRVSKEQV